MVPPTNTPVVPPTNTPVVPPTNTPVVPPTNTPVIPPPDSPGALPDLVLTKSVVPSVAQVGDAVVYTLTLSNSGGVPAFDVMVEDPLPPFLRLIEASASTGTVQTVGNQVRVTIPTLAPGETVTITIRAAVTALPMPPDNRNLATARTSSSEITTDNNTSSATIVPPLPDLVLAKSVAPSVAQVGDAVVYTLTLSNRGSAPAVDVTVDDPLPPFLRLIEASASTGTVQTVGNQVRVTIPTLAPGETVTITIRAAVTALPMPPDNRNLATARTSSSEITTDNNTSSATINSPPPATLPLTAGYPVRPLFALIGLALLAIGMGTLLRRRSSL
uniref:DUF11 domain-containing protein n=1 Tax=Chloroflexus aggregans TaxID=152260 RepID=UPI0038B9A8B6